jgi:hypothetical protein
MRYAPLLIVLLLACDQRADVGDLPARTDGGVMIADSGVGPMPQPADSIGEFCRAFHEIRCEASPTCCSDPDRTYDSVSECVAAESQDCVDHIRDLPVVRLGKAKLDVAASFTLLTWADQAAQTCTNEGAYGIPLEGTLPRDSDCTFSNSDGFVFACAPGLFCIADSVEGTAGRELYRARCGDPLPTGASCLAGAPLQCGAGHYCDGTCKASLPRNSACTSDRECEGRLICSPTTQRCDLAPLSADDAYCPLGSVPRVSWGGPSNCGSGRSSGFDQCAYDWTCPGGMYRVECTTDANGTDSCRCLLDGVERGSFTAANVCAGVTPGPWERAQASCGFP